MKQPKKTKKNANQTIAVIWAESVCMDKIIDENHIRLIYESFYNIKQHFGSSILSACLFNG